MGLGVLFLKGDQIGFTRLVSQSSASQETLYHELIRLSSTSACWQHVGCIQTKGRTRQIQKILVRERRFHSEGHPSVTTVLLLEAVSTASVRGQLGVSPVLLAYCCQVYALCFSVWKVGPHSHPLVSFCSLSFALSLLFTFAEAQHEIFGCSAELSDSVYFLINVIN